MQVPEPEKFLSPPATPQALFKILEDLGIAFQLHRHAPIFTVEEGAHLKEAIPGVHCRNLFLRDKKHSMFLVVAANETQIDLRKLPGLIGAGRLSFGSPERLMRYLGVRPGSVCPFAAVNDKAHEVAIMLDAGMMGEEIVNYHPLDNAMTVSLKPADLLEFFSFTGHAPRIIDLTLAAPDPT